MEKTQPVPASLLRKIMGYVGLGPDLPISQLAGKLYISRGTVRMPFLVPALVFSINSTAYAPKYLLAKSTSRLLPSLFSCLGRLTKHWRERGGGREREREREYTVSSFEQNEVQSH